MGTKTKRLEIRAEEGFINELNRLAEASGTTRAEVIDRAIGLYATALHEVEQGKTLKFVFPDSAPSTAIPMGAPMPMGAPAAALHDVGTSFGASQQEPGTYAAELNR
jgi:hypothetical protein